MTGEWNIDVVVGSLPEKLATAFSEINLVGAEYEPIAYLGTQVVNGINHGVLAEQTLLTLDGQKNVVLMIFNEKNDQFTLVNIERVLESGEGEGGVVVDVQTDIPEEAEDAFEQALGGFVGEAVEPFAYLGDQVVRGIDYFFAAETTSSTAEPDKGVALVVVNSTENTVSFAEIL